MTIGLLLTVLFPFIFADIMATALLKLRLSPTAAFLIVVGIFVGGLVNIPLKRIVHEELGATHPLSAFGLWALFPRWQRARRETIVAVNVGGCLIPMGLVVWELVGLVGESGQTWIALATAVILNVVVCYVVARPEPRIGILMPGFVPPLVALLAAVSLAPDHAVPVAFIAGVLGPVVGADLLHLREIQRSHVGMLSIGGAGTFDGIVLSGILAAYLA